MSLQIIKSNEYDKIISSQQIADKIKSELDNKIEQARSQAQRLVAEAQVQAQQLKQQAYYDAYTHSYEYMVNEMLTSKLVKQTLITSAIPFYEALIKKLHHKMIGTLEVSDRINKVLHDELTSLLRANEITIVIHPDMLTETKANLQCSENPLCKNLFFKTDINLKPNEFIIQTKDMTIVADSVSQTQLLNQVLDRAKQKLSQATNNST
ncbi:HrpE/YscL family type III secretion apparatus protein [Spartinivicinus ruber]|uniref:HrpE/YscL family type III secretion apparatus protein n=1 Tax=Spartinivicinus ruber TaxID=2683272 RepID=UPI0013D04EF7|nr:HrpE/YscL family type III secretion apparatus protein [Spartinivicinus ruber]